MVSSLLSLCVAEQARAHTRKCSTKAVNVYECLFSSSVRAQEGMKGNSLLSVSLLACITCRSLQQNENTSCYITNDSEPQEFYGLKVSDITESFQSAARQARFLPTNTHSHSKPLYNFTMTRTFDPIFTLPL